MRSKLGAGTLFVLAAVALLAAILFWRYWHDPKGQGPETRGPRTRGEAPARAGTGSAVPLQELERRATADPDSSAAWQELGLAYFERERFDNAILAYEKAVRADEYSAFLWSALGEARVMASRADPLPAEGLAAFRKAAAIDPADPRARYFLAVEKDLAGDHEGALDAWLALLADTPGGAPWELDLVRTIQQVGAINDIAVSERIARASSSRDLLPQAALGAIPGPTPQQLQAASSLTPGQQQDMAEGMVARLAARLEANPADPRGWVMLMRSYATLGRDDQARHALARGLAANPQAAPSLREAAGQLGIDIAN